MGTCRKATQWSGETPYLRIKICISRDIVPITSNRKTVLGKEVVHLFSVDGKMQVKLSKCVESMRIYPSRDSLFSLVPLHKETNIFLSSYKTGSMKFLKVVNTFVSLAGAY